MSAFQAPLYYFSGIAFNSAFYNETTSGDLTLSQANALYLRKTTADTATALETFTGGIASNSIQSTTATTDMSIGSSQTNGILNLGTGGLRTATGAINIGTGGTSSPCIVNIANGGVTQQGSVNIANTGGATISTAVNIGNGSSTGFVTIGNPANNVLLNGASILIANNSVGGIVQIKNANNSVGEVQIVTSSGGTNTTPVKISTGTTTGAVTIGSSSNTTNFNSATLNIGGNLTMGTGKNITLAPTTSIVAPTAFTQLGGTSTNKNAIALTLGLGIVVNPVQITRAGTYLFTCGAQLTNTSAFTTFYSNIYESSTAQTLNTLATQGSGIGVIHTQGNFGQQPMGSVSGLQTMSTNGSYVYTVPESKANFYYSLVIYASGGGTLGTLGTELTITRLA